MSLSSKTQERIKQAIADQRLPTEFVNTVNQYYALLSQRLYKTHYQKKLNQGLKFFGIQGSQGSGKSTCASFLKLILESEYGLKVVVSSIDDFYLTREERQHLANDVHPLFLTRGVPGTHDIQLLLNVFKAAKMAKSFTLPIFDKSIDDRAAPDQFQTIDSAVDIVILEGWCVGISAQNTQELNTPINDLEEKEDSDARWRTGVNNALSGEYQTLFSQLDVLISLQAPSFECVLGWRQLQEDKMIAKLKREGKSIERAQSKDELIRFISHYQRLTEHALMTMPSKADYVLQLGPDHQFTDLRVNT